MSSLSYLNLRFFILSIWDEAMHFHVFRYLSKPLDKKRFLRNFQDALAYYNTMTQKIPIETHDGIYTVPYSHIIAIEAHGKKGDHTYDKNIPNLKNTYLLIS